MSYERRFDLLPSHVEVALTVSTDQAIEFKALYETLPMLLAADTRVVLIDAKGAAIASEAVERVEGVKELQILRQEGGVRVIFKDPAVIAQVSKKVDTVLRPAIISTQALQVELPTKLSQSTKATLRYALVPCAVQNGAAVRDATPSLFATKR